MPLSAGDTIGTYEVLSPIGAGGMGEVYRARDTRLDREVALKVLPTLFTEDRDRLTRFEREARTLAALNHPNIAQIYGVVDSPAGDGSPPIPALVMEFVAGEDLADRVARGPLPASEAIRIATQIAEALDAAHDRGIVHRDLKPANIKLTPDGSVKVLDFGVAKALDLVSGTSDTVTSHDVTRDGVVIGTASYMSPEQARGLPVDRRTDIWAFGCVLYEMLTGRRAFRGETTSDISAAILTAEPDWSALPAATPASVRRVLTRLLQKDLKQRLRDIADVRFALEEAGFDATIEASSAASAYAPNMAGARHCLDGARHFAWRHAARGHSAIVRRGTCRRQPGSRHAANGQRRVRVQPSPCSRWRLVRLRLERWRTARYLPPADRGRRAGPSHPGRCG